MHKRVGVIFQSDLAACISQIKAPRASRPCGGNGSYQEATIGG
jgi:hypothetical protein